MKLIDILKTVGAGVVREAVPGGGLLLDVVNEFLPSDKKLPASATGNDINSAIATLPADQQAALLGREFDVSVAHIRQSNETLRAMLEADFKSPHTTRPYIAKGAFLVVAFSVITVISMWAYGVLASDNDLVDTVVGGWQFVLAAIGPLVTLLWAYFGVLKTEHKNRLNAANGTLAGSGIAGVLSALIRR